MCATLFLIASLCCIHSVRGYISLNVTSMQAPAQRNQDQYASLKHELTEGQAHLSALRTSLIRTRGRRRTRLLREIKRQSKKIMATRKTLAQVRISVHVSPLTGMEWFLALTLWFFNATCWTAWFGTKGSGPAVATGMPGNIDTVSDWLMTYKTREPQHCRALHDAYSQWCAQQGRKPLARYSFYARLTELGARKFRDGRNGPTMYALPSKWLSKPL